MLIAGLTGSGKTTLARRIAADWGLPHTELDSLFHGPNWTPRASFLEDVRALSTQSHWVTEWQYTSRGVGTFLVPRAQLAIWLDYPYRIVRWRLIRRTIVRRLLRIELWNGNREHGLTRLFSRDPEENILHWQRLTRNKWAERMPGYIAQFPHLTVVRLRHPRETEDWLRAQAVVVGASTAPPKRLSRDR